MTDSSPGSLEARLRHPLRALQVDLERYFPEDRAWSWPRRVRRVMHSHEIWVLVCFRWGAWIRGFPQPLRTLCWIGWAPVNRFVATLLDSHIPPDTRIGPGLYLGHTGGIWINPRAQLGACCNLGQGVVIGAAGGAERAPILGDRCWLGPHAVVTGPIRVGDDVVIGANSLVATALPDRSVALGVPARVLTRSGSFRLVRVPPTLRALWAGMRPGDAPAGRAGAGPGTVSFPNDEAVSE